MRPLNQEEALPVGRFFIGIFSEIPYEKAQRTLFCFLILFGKISDLFDDIKTALRGCTCGEGQNTILGLRIKYDYFCYFFVRLYAIGYISRPEKN